VLQHLSEKSNRKTRRSSPVSKTSSFKYESKLKHQSLEGEGGEKSQVGYAKAFIPRHVHKQQQQQTNKTNFIS